MALAHLNDELGPRRLVRFYCPEHGYLCTTSERAIVTCGVAVSAKGIKRRCNKRARPKGMVA